MGGEMKALIIRLEALEGPGQLVAKLGDRIMEFHISRKARDALGISESLFTSTGNVILPDFHSARNLARRINERVDAALLPERAMRAGRLNAMALIDEILHDVARIFRERVAPDAFRLALASLEGELGPGGLEDLLLAFTEQFPPVAVYRGEVSAKDWLAGGEPKAANRAPAATRREQALEELLLLRLANENPAFGPFRVLFDETLIADPGSTTAAAYAAAVRALERHFAALPAFGPDDQDLVTMLRSPAIAAPYSLPGQLDYIRSRWGLLLGDKLLRLLGALDLIHEEEKPRFPGPGPTRAYVYSGMEREYERFTPDKDWMPNVVMMAKSSLVWLHQLSVAYGRDIRSLDAVPDEELDLLASRGFNALWLIGLWERSAASAEIKRRCGNPEAAASAYSLFDYEIAAEFGGWPALERLRERCSWRGIRLAADMVPNHTGIDSAWVRDRPDLFMQSDYCPYPGYGFNGGDLSGDGRVGIWLEDHYYDRSDAAVVFKRLDRGSGRVSYIYHGNDGTGMPWNDTAQIDFLKPEAREAVKERILHVARNFPIIRFDAAMVLAKRHFRRLWYPEPGRGGDVPSRSEHATPPEAFDAAMPEEFWREVVDLCAKEAPDTLLLAEAFWMMEGYFVRTLGMHRVYNSAFMNMLKREENSKYRETIKNTQEFDKDILKRFVNFMNNPDEDTAVAQFGRGDKYFGVCTLMATMPGLPMFGHGQLEGFEEKYGMEYRRAYRDESPDRDLVERHEREIFPLLKKRHLFSGVEQFLLYDVHGPDGAVNENVFVYSNGAGSGRGSDKALVVYNNAYARAEGWIRESCSFAEKLPGGGKRLARRSLAEALGLTPEEGRFSVMREQRSNLWYLRRSGELAESGLRVLLDGYQCQVFLDLFEVADDARGLYRAVYDRLGGAGTPDLAAAIQDVALKELYAALAVLVRPELFEALRRAVGPVKPAGRKSPSPSPGVSSLESHIEGVAAPAGEFYRVVRALLREAAAEEGLPGDPPVVSASFEGPTRSTEDAAVIAAALLKADEAAVSAARDRFVNGLGSLAGLIAMVAAPAAGDGPGEERRAAALLVEELASPGRAELAACYLVLDGLKALAGPQLAGEEARRLADRFFLDRKLREALRDAGMAGDAAFHGMALAKALLARSDPSGPEKKGLLGLLREGAEDDELRALLGVNIFDGVTWFHRERFEEAVRFGTLLGALTAPAPEGQKAGAKKISPAKPEAARSAALAAAKIGLAFLDAEARSGYRLDGLEAALSEEESGIKPRAKRAPKEKK